MKEEDVRMKLRKRIKRRGRRKLKEIIKIRVRRKLKKNKKGK